MRYGDAMARLFLRILAAAAALVLLAFPLIFASDSGGVGEPDPASIVDYRADMAIKQDGSLDVVETVVTEMPVGRHGIFRFWDVTDAHDPHARLIPSNISVTLDGEAEPFDVSWQDGRRFRVARIGDPDVFVSEGTHTYEIRYRIDGAVTPAGRGNAGDTSVARFDWWAVPPGWAMSIDTATVTITSPTPLDSAMCEVRNNLGTCSVSGSDSTTVTVTSGALAPRTGVSLGALLPGLDVERSSVPWSIRFEPILGRSPVLVVLFVILGVGGFVLGYLRERRSREVPPGAPLSYRPPNDLGPVQTYYVIEEETPDNGLTATVMHLADRGYVTMEQDGSDWIVRAADDAPDASTLDPVAAAALSGLGLTRSGASFRVDRTVAAGKRVGEINGTIDLAARQWGRDAGYVTKASSETRDRVLIVLTAIAAVAALFLLPIPGTIDVLPLLAFTVGGIGLLGPGIGTRRTSAGRRIWAEGAGFRTVLTTPQAQSRFDFSAREDLYLAYIPYAVVFDAADAWAERYRAETGHEPPEPSYVYAGTGGFGGGSFASAVANSFESTVSSAVGAYAASQRSSSSSGSGFSGGGFSGGGGGGGGGGSW